MQKNLSGTLPISKPGIFIPRRDLALWITAAFGVFIGRTVVFSFVSPLCVPFLVSFFGTGPVFYFTAFCLTLGLSTQLTDIFVARCIIAIALLCVYHFFAKKICDAKNSRTWKQFPGMAAAASASALVSGVTAAALMGNSPFLYVVAMMETVLAGSLTLIIKRAHVLLTSRRRRSQFLTGEDIIALSLLMAGVIAGAAGIYVAETPLHYILCLYVLYLVAYKGGPSMAATAGLVLGFFLHMAGYFDIAMAAVLGLAGAAGGFGRKWGRLASVAGAVAAGGLLMYLLVRSELVFPLVYTVIVSALAFMLTPQSFYFNLAAAIVPSPDTAEDYMEKIKEETTGRLDSFSSAFEKLADTFKGLSKPKTSLNKQDITQLIDELAARFCADCSLRKSCWEENFYQTYQRIFGLLDVCAREGEASLEDFDLSFTCVSKEKLLAGLNSIFNTYKQNLVWHNRIAESRDLVSQQLSGVAGIIASLSEEIDMSLTFHESLEEEMIASFLKNKLEVSGVIVLENKMGKYQVTVNHRPCYNKRLCESEIKPVLYSVLKRKMRLESTDCNIKKGVCSVRFVEEQKYRVTGGVSHRAKNARDGSGDSYSFMELKNGSCLLVLSDGMGSGERARRESAATVGLLEDFIESGFEKELAVKMINSVLVLKSSEESFSTLDICSVDLYTGEAEFIKIGASSTFLLRNGKVSVIKSSTLPMGMLSSVDFECSAKKLQHDDIILMITDGVTDAIGPGYDQEGWLSETLRSCRYANPQDVSDYILGEAERAVKAAPRDDMTVLAARVWEK
jgi:stage II sporulation protein E